MSIVNGYLTLADYKARATAAGQTMSTDATDDGVIERLIQAASRHIDTETQRTCYPRVETHLYDIPPGLEIELDDDLLEVITFSNGDGDAFAAGQYRLEPANKYPKYLIALKDSATTLWELNSSGSSQQVISLVAYWGYHKNYNLRAWAAAGTLGAAQTSLTSLSFTMTTGHSLQTTGGQIVKIDSELLITTATGATTLTALARGENGSTTATHINGSTVYTWEVMPDIQQAAFEIALNAYHRRFGQNLGGASIMTPGGAVIGPRDVTELAAATINGLKRRS